MGSLDLVRECRPLPLWEARDNLPPGDTWGLESAELLRERSVYLLKKSSGAKPGVTRVCGVLETVVPWICA